MLPSQCVHSVGIFAVGLDLRNPSVAQHVHNFGRRYISLALEILIMGTGETGSEQMGLIRAPRSLRESANWNPSCKEDGVT